MTMAQPAVKPPHFELPPLPFAEDALAPILSAETLSFHYGKHHRKYVDTMNRLLQQNPMRASSLEEVVRAASGKLFNNAAQAWNHDFYWHSLSPRGGRPSDALARQIDKDFGSYERFVDELTARAAGQFGSGWAWLVQHEGRLQVMTTPNAETPMAKGVPCLLTIDVWEHAYYIDYRNQRERYLKELIDKRLNWQFAEENWSRIK
jgi:Fe-Mn family superoxide dismutase